MSLQTTKPKWIHLLVHGFIRREEGKQTLSTSIPNGIALFIINYFPYQFCFGLHDKDLFAASDNDKKIKAIDEDPTCDGYIIYADLYDKNEIGFDSGVYYWSIKALRTTYYDDPTFTYYAEYSACYRSIGVTTLRNEDIITKGMDSYLESNEHHHSYYSIGHSTGDGACGWGFNKIITIELDCEKWVVSYYRDGIFIRNDDIEPNRCYFLALCS